MFNFYDRISLGWNTGESGCIGPGYGDANAVPHAKENGSRDQTKRDLRDFTGHKGGAVFSLICVERRIDFIRRLVVGDFSM